MALGILGIPIPDETILTFSGYLVSQKVLLTIPTILTAYLGSISGISISFFIGRKFGLNFLHKHGRFFHFTEERVHKTKSWFESYGEWLFLFGYFIPGVRHLTALLAGSVNTKYLRFALFAYTGGFLWTLTFIIIGLNVGRNWENIISQFHNHIIIIVLIIITMIFLVLLIRKISFIIYKQKK